MGSVESFKKSKHGGRAFKKIDASLNEKLRGVEWGEYSLRDLFHKKTVKGVPKSEEDLTPIKDGYHVFGQNIKYQYPQKVKMADKYLQTVDENSPILAYTSSVGEVGIIKESFYRSGNNGAFQGLFPKKHQFSYRQLQFILPAIKKHFDLFGYDTGMADVIDLKIELPIKNNEIDFDFMESFVAELEAQRVAELEAQRVAELEAYLSVTGLKDTHLLPEEEQALLDFEKIGWGEFNLEKLYGKSTRGKRLKSADRIEGTLPFVTAGEANEGISAFIGNDVQIFSRNTTTIDMFGSAKYRNYKYGGDDHIAVVHTESLSKFAAIFLTSAIHKSSHNGQFDYGRNFYAKDADALNIMLPVIDNKPDYDKMELIISAIHKLVIKDVVDYSDKKIAATKSVIT